MRPLSPRQDEVMRLVVKGLINKEIAASLGISVRTVKNHICNMGVRIGGDGGRPRLLAWWLARHMDEARDEGYAAGYRHGYVDGLDAGTRGDRRTAPALAARSAAQ